VLTQSWLSRQGGSEESWRFDLKFAGGGILADAGDHLIDALLWTTGRAAVEVCAVQNKLESGLDLVTAAAIQLTDGTPATLAVSGVSPSSLFSIDYFGDRGRLHATDRHLESEGEDGSVHAVPLSSQAESIDGDFVTALLRGSSPCCPADEALDTVRLIEAISRSAATGNLVRVL
jgi:predicted dehydrogenase